MFTKMAVSFKMSDSKITRISTALLIIVCSIFGISHISIFLFFQEPRI
jgi:hypothetical protein